MAGSGSPNPTSKARQKLKKTFETDVFVNEPGYITISQSDEQALIMLSPEQAKLVVQEITKLLRTSDEWWVPVEREENELA